MKKIMVFILAILSSLCLEVNAVNTSVTPERNAKKYEYVQGLQIYQNKAGSSDLFVLDIDSYFNSYKSYSNPEYADAGIQYIVNSSGNLLSNTQKDYYITQAAILWYMDYLNGNNHNISSTVKRNMQNNQNVMIKYIIDLVEGAKNYKETTPYIEIDDDITFRKSGSYYYSNDIELYYGGLVGTPSISFYNAPGNTTISNKELSSDGGYFQIRIPVSSFNSFYNDGFEIYVKGKSPRKKAYTYSDGYEDVLYVYNYSGLDNNVEKYIYIEMDDIDYDNYSNTNVRIKVVDDRGNYIKNVKYYLYEGNCENTTCYSGDYITSFTTTSGYKTFTTLEPGRYTLVKKTNTTYDLNEKELINVKDTPSVQTITISEDGYYYDDDYYEDDYYYDDYYDDDYYDDEYRNVTIYNSINDASNVIKIYKNNGTFVSSYRSNNNKYKIELKEGKYYIIDSSNDFNKVYFEISSSNRLYIIENNQKYEVAYIDLDKYLIRYPSNDNSGSINNNTNNNTTNNNTTNNNITNDYYTDENGTIHIGSLDNIGSIEVSQEVKTETSWISNIIDCPITSVSSTIKYIIGAIILVIGIILTIRNVKKQKNNI